MTSRPASGARSRARSRQSRPAPPRPHSSAPCRPDYDRARISHPIRVLRSRPPWIPAPAREASRMFLLAPDAARAQFAGAGFTTILYRGSPLYGWLSTSGLAVQRRRLIDAREQLVYAYYDGPDLVSHMHGLRDEFFTRELAFCDALVGD